MMKVTYGITEETYSFSDIARTWYGVAAYAEAEKEGTACVVEIVHDVSDDRRRLGALVDLCNLLELDPIHVADIVDDFLAQR